MSKDKYLDNWDEMMQNYGLIKNPLSKQIGGDHYKSASIQPIEVIRDWNLNFETGNALKYIARHKLKGEPKKDIEKAIHYLEMYKETLSD
jgi:hypothetical protein